MNSKQTLLTIWLLYISILACAQGTNPTPEQLNHFKETTTLVVLDGRDVAFDAMLSESIRKYWKITPYEIINSDRFEKMKSNSAFSFLVLTQSAFNKDKIEYSYNFLNLLLSHPTGDMNNMPVLAYIPYCGSPFTSNEHIYKTGMLLKSIQYQIEQRLDNPKSSNGKLSSYNRNISKLKNRTLILQKENIEADIADSSTLRKLYKNNLKIASRDEVEKTVLNETEKVVVLHIVKSDDNATAGRCYKMLIDANNGTIYYYNMDMINPSKPGKFLKKDFRKIRWSPFHWI